MLDTEDQPITLRQQITVLATTIYTIGQECLSLPSEKRQAAGKAYVSCANMLWKTLSQTDDEVLSK